MANEEDYFIAANSVGAINEEQYKKLDVLIHTTEVYHALYTKACILSIITRKDSCMYQRILCSFVDTQQKR